MRLRCSPRTQPIAARSPISTPSSPIVRVAAGYEDESDSEESAAASQPRFLRFAAPGGEIDVHLLVIVEAGVVSVSGQIVARNGGPLDWEVSAHRAPNRDAIGRTRATSGGLFQLRYDPPAMALLRFNQSRDSAPVDISIDADE